MFSTKQQIVMLLTKPEANDFPTTTNPTIRFIQRGLKIHFGRTVTKRHITRLLKDLEQEGILQRDVTAWRTQGENPHTWGSLLTVLDFEKAFQDIRDLKTSRRNYKRRQRRRKSTP